MIFSEKGTGFSPYINPSTHLEINPRGVSRAENYRLELL
jgi:hypothetical protein